MQVHRQYALKLNFTKIEFESVNRRLIFFVPSTDNQNYLDKSLQTDYFPSYSVKCFSRFMLRHLVTS